MVLSGNNTFALFKPYLELIKTDCTSTTPNTIYRSKYTLLGFPLEYFKRDKQYHNTAVLAYYLVNANKAKWIKFDVDAVNPEIAKNEHKRNVIAENRKKRTSVWLQTLSGEEKEQFYKNNAIKSKATREAQKTHLLDDILPNYLK